MSVNIADAKARNSRWTMLFLGGVVVHIAGIMLSRHVSLATAARLDGHRLKQGCHCCGSQNPLVTMVSVYHITICVHMPSGGNTCQGKRNIPLFSIPVPRYLAQW